MIAQRNLATPGGSETFVLTIAEHLARLGHEVAIQARWLGLAAKLAHERAINVTDNAANLPGEADATISLDRVMAIELALRYPTATRLYAMHNSEEPWLPPPMAGVVAATIAPNDRLALLASGCTGAGEVVRMTQPVDLRRFSPRGWARDRPIHILLIGNYLQISGQRVGELQRAWSRPGLEWHRVGNPEPTTAVAEEMAKADIVVGYGRSILEAMACGRPAYVHDHSGSDGWVTTESYDLLEADGFAGTGVRRTPDLDQLRHDFLRYDPALGRVGQDLVRTHHDARAVAAKIVGLVERLGRPSRQPDQSALHALRNLAENHLRADLLADQYRVEAKQQAEARRNEDLLREQENLRHEEEKERLREEIRRLGCTIDTTKDTFDTIKNKLDTIMRSYRFALANLIFRPIDGLRRLRDRMRR